MDYKDLNDNELIYYINENIEEAREVLLQKYMQVVEAKAKKYLKAVEKTGLEFNDLMQEGLLAINHAIDYFDEKKDITFYTYVNTCIENKLINIVVRSKGNKFKALNEAIPYESDDEEDINLSNVISDNKINPETVIFDREYESKLIEEIRKELTDFETQVFDLKMTDFTYKEIADLLDKSPKAIDNALQRIKQKVKEQLKKQL